MYLMFSFLFIFIELYIFFLLPALPLPFMISMKLHFLLKFFLFITEYVYMIPVTVHMSISQCTCKGKRMTLKNRVFHYVIQGQNSGHWLSASTLTLRCPPSPSIPPIKPHQLCFFFHSWNKSHFNYNIPDKYSPLYTGR